jgi:hypothetical protein
MAYDGAIPCLKEQKCTSNVQKMKLEYPGISFGGFDIAI